VAITTSNTTGFNVKQKTSMKKRSLENKKVNAARKLKRAGMKTCFLMSLIIFTKLESLFTEQKISFLRFHGAALR